jgi:hypothetical protein
MMANRVYGITGGAQAAPPPEQGRVERRLSNDPGLFWATLAGVVAVVAYTGVAALQSWTFEPDGQKGADYSSQEEAFELAALDAASSGHIRRPEPVRLSGEFGVASPRREY